MIARVALPLTVLPLAVLSLAGCGADPAPAPSSPVAAPTISTPTPTPSPTPTVFLGSGVSLHYSCDELVGPHTIASLDKKLTVDDSYLPAETTSAARAVAIRGTACRWVDSSTGMSLIVTAAHPDPPTLIDLRQSTAGYAKSTTLFGSDVAGYVVNTQVEVFSRNGYWATATSPLFADQAVAKTVMAAVIQSLPTT